jgi:uncharacterized protein (TIGR03435 family)
MTKPDKRGPLHKRQHRLAAKRTAPFCIVVLALAQVLLRAQPVPSVPPSTLSRLAAEQQAASGAGLAFEVASIRPGEPGKAGPSNFEFDADDSYESADPEGRLSADFPLRVYIEFAYRISPTPEQERVMLAHLPKWVSSEEFAIQARAEGKPTKDQMRLMMQSLLAERFKLAVHFETHETAVLAMKLEKSGRTGPNLRPHSLGSPCNVPTAPKIQDASANFTGVFPWGCGGYAAIDRPNRDVLWGSRDTTVSLMAASLGLVGNLGRPVVDETGLDGRYDFTLEWNPRANAPQPPGADTQPNTSETTLMEALKEQLGLRLQPARAPVKTLVIDHVEQPSAN